MKYFNKNAVLPGGNVLIEEIDRAAAELDEKIGSLEIEKLSISDYNKRYLSSYVKERKAVIQRYAFVLAWGLASEKKGRVLPKDAVILDYGGGTGMMCLLAKTMGIGKVIYNDIYDVSCRDAKEIGSRLGLEADAYIHGELDEVISYVESKNVSVDVVANNDVIEHVYDMGAFIKNIPRLSRSRLRVALATGANAMNPYMSLRLMRLQWQREHSERSAEWGRKETDATRSYLDIRMEIVREREPGLTEKEVQYMAVATRGKNESDIKKDVEAYVKHGVRPAEMLHPTNTCDPISSSWAEHLMSPWWVTARMREAGLNPQVVPGPYGWREGNLKRMIAGRLDHAIMKLGAKGVIFSPFVVYVGEK
jgi:2-polyprenyl-3-methyl-5-hydroxy-6-metoxy-1,4-benzoquinol methylase